MEAVIDMILAETNTVAVVGLSDRAERPSNAVARYMKERGYRIIPVNPRLSDVLGEKAYPSLSDIPGKVDLVDVFRKSGEVPALAEEAIRVGARFFWMQEGVVDEGAAKEAQAAGLLVVMDRCMKKCQQQLFRQ